MLYSKMKLDNDISTHFYDGHQCETASMKLPKNEAPTEQDKNDMTTEINTSELFGEYGSFDIGRIPPRVFLQIPAAMQSVRDEIDGLLKRDVNGIPVGKL